MDRQNSKIFEGFRALGLYSADLPHVLKYNQARKEYLIYCAVGKVFHSYKCPKLTLTRVSNQHESDIECIAADDIYVYTSCKNNIYATLLSQFVKFTFSGHNHPVHIILPFDKHLITVDRQSNVMVWHIESQTLYLSLEFNNATFEISTALHPITYVNKILFASKQGTMQLWNISKNKLIYEFKTLKESPITVLAQAPAVDVVGVGNEDGEIVMINLRVDRVLMQFSQEGGRITSLSFRTDGETVMAAGNAIGHVYFWDLESKKVKGMIEKAHSSAVANVTYMENKSLLVTNSPDNSIKIWQFEKGSGTGTLLHQATGHVGSLTKIRFYKEDSIVSAGQDSTLKVFSCAHKITKNLGQASLNRKRARKCGIKFDDAKLPPVVDFSIESTKEGEWDGLVAAHYRHPVATTWNLQCNRMGAHKFVYGDEKINVCDSRAAIGSDYVSTVASTSCGNFCLIGYSRGYVEVYNIQSGFHRGSFIDSTLDQKKAHQLQVQAICVDSLNQLLITVGLEKRIKFWKFKQKLLLQSMELEVQPAAATLHRDSSLLAVILDDFSFMVIDVETRRVVRKFSGHVGAISDLAWSDDARWVVTSGTDCCVKTWDVPSAALIDCFLVDTPVVSLALSPASDFLATAHVDDVGIYLWSNRTLYGYVNLSPLPQDYHPEKVQDLPSTLALRDGEEVEAEEQEFVGEEPTPKSEREQLALELLTLSSLPYARWANVLHLDNIRKRNKPNEPPKAPKSAPFFLPTVASLKPEFLIAEDKDKSKVAKVDPIQHFSPFALTLLESEDNYHKFMTLLKSMSLLEIDREIKALSPEGGGSVGLLEAFLGFIEHAVESKKNFEIVQAYFSLFLSVHVDALSQMNDIESKLKSIDFKLNKDRIELAKLLNQSLCIVNYIKSATV